MLRTLTTRSLLTVRTRGFASGTKYFTADHEYVIVDAAKKTGTVGITQFAADALGDVIFAELPTAGSTFKQKEAFGAVESVKASSSVYAPVDVKVTDINGELSGNPGLINTEPFTGGFMLKVEVTNPSQLDQLMNEEQYTKFCSEKH